MNISGVTDTWRFVFGELHSLTSKDKDELLCNVGNTVAPCSNFGA